MHKPSIVPHNSFTQRLLLALLAACLVVPAWAGAARAASMDEIKKRGLIVATEDDFRPFEFVKDGKPTGFDNELIEDLRKYAPFEIKQEILPWTGILAGVSTGKYDVAITAAIITKERKQSLDFTSPIADATHYYVKRKDDKSISSVKDLDSKTVGVQAGSALLARLPELGAMLEKQGGKLGKVVEYTSYPEAYQDLALGRVDYVVNTVINLKTLAAEKPTVF
jgi:polar amino acid transport system substrate-binding protein